MAHVGRYGVKAATGHSLPQTAWVFPRTRLRASLRLLRDVKVENVADRSAREQEAGSDLYVAGCGSAAYPAGIGDGRTYCRAILQQAFKRDGSPLIQPASIGRIVVDDTRGNIVRTRSSVAARSAASVPASVPSGRSQRHHLRAAIASRLR